MQPRVSCTVQGSFGLTGVRFITYLALQKGQVSRCQTPREINEVFVEDFCFYRDVGASRIRSWVPRLGEGAGPIFGALDVWGRFLVCLASLSFWFFANVT
jgi:hypothetical protein